MRFLGFFGNALFKTTSLTWVLLSRSEPAKSTRFNFESVYFSSDVVNDLLSTRIVNMQCDLELSLLSICVPIDLFVSPLKFFIKCNSFNLDQSYVIIL